MITLVTGATSGLGRNAVEHLAALAQPVRGTGRDRKVGAALRTQGIEFVAADLATAQEADFDRLLDGVDTVWHCAALSSPWGRYRDFYAANVEATARLAEAAVLRGVRRFVHISTPSVYSDYQHRLGIAETFRPARYVSHYASTKAQAEGVIRAMAARHRATGFVMLRPRAIFGPHDRALLPRILRVLRARHGRLPLPRGGNVRLDLTYVANVVHAMHLATNCEGLAPGEVFNITNGESATLRSVLEALLVPLGVPFRIVAPPYRILDAAARLMEVYATFSETEPALTRSSLGNLYYDMTLNIDKARTRLGYAPVTSLAEGIATTIEWIKTHGDDYGF
ncbi:MAG: NAD-dependent epimerase/dehydratase family protein [Burkholderiaceae bacterium]|jgi:nucleoside-diphosphate-sugar epimerase|nr:NAD-dependent epimerase/dehydratase family protein [Burkholderiaceae bacterium]